MTYQVIASNGKSSKVVRWRFGIGREFTDFDDRETAEVHAAVLAADTPGVKFHVRDASQAELHAEAVRDVLPDSGVDAD